MLLRCLQGLCRLHLLRALDCFAFLEIVSLLLVNPAAGFNDSCVAPGVTNAAAQGSCQEGATILSGDNCSTQCEPGYSPSVQYLDCTDGVLTPLTFLCQDAPCSIPSVPYAAAKPCGPQQAYSSSVLGGSTCTPSCIEGYVPSERRLYCSHGVFSPATFQCSKVCRHQCSQLTVVYGQSRGMSLLAQALFSHLTCASFKPWVVGQTLARADYLVVSGVDFVGLAAGILHYEGFSGVAVFVDGGCGTFRNAPTPLPYLDGLEERVLYVGTDRQAASLYGEFLEVPPGAVTQLAARQGVSSWSDAERDLRTLLAAERPESTWPPKTKFLAYAADECDPVVEDFFDELVERFSSEGTIEVLGACSGSHPELKVHPPYCGGRSPGWCVDNYRSNLTAILEPFRFALTFEASAKSMTRCPQHVGGVGFCLPGAGFPGAGGISVFDALAAGAVPIFRGPTEAIAVVEKGAVIYVSGQCLVQELMKAFTDAVNSPTLERALRTAPALPIKAAQRWFALHAQMRGEVGELSQEAALYAGRLMANSTHGRCTHYVEKWTPNSEAGDCLPGAAAGVCIA